MGFRPFSSALAFLSLNFLFTLFNLYSKMPLRNDVAGMETIRKAKYNKLSAEEKKSPFLPKVKPEYLQCL